MISVLLKLLVFIFCRRRESETPRRILVIRPDERLGNVVLTTPLLAEVRRIYPESQIDVLVASRYAALLSEYGHNIGVIPFEKRDLFKHPFLWLSLMLNLRRTAYDIAIDASHEHAFSFTSALVTIWSGCPVRIGHKRQGSDEAYTHSVPASPEEMPEADRKLRLLEPLTAEAHECKPWLGRNTSMADKWADEWLAENNQQKKRLLAVFTGARKSDRRLTGADFLFVSQQMKKSENWKLLFICGSGDTERIESLRLMFSDCDALYAPDVDLRGLWALLARSDAVVCADTGPLHLAWALGKPLLSLHTAGNVARWGHRDGLNCAVSFTSDLPESQVIAAETLAGIIKEIERHENT